MHNELLMTSKMNSIHSRRTSTSRESKFYAKNPQGVDLDEKRRKTFEMIRLAKSQNDFSKNETALEHAQAAHDYDPSLMFDERGRLFRWVKAPFEHKPMITECCEKKHPTKLQHDHVFVEKLEIFDTKLFDDI